MNLICGHLCVIDYKILNLRQETIVRIHIVKLKNILL